MVDQMVGWQREGLVCVAAFDPPGAVGRYERWKAAHLNDFGSPDEWIVNLGRAVGGGDFASVWVPRQHLPPEFPISDKHI
jgi:hypothetical protein